MQDFIQQPFGNYRIDDIIHEELQNNDIIDAVREPAMPFGNALRIPVTNDEAKVVQACNNIFHRFRLLPQCATIHMGDSDMYCELGRVLYRDKEFYAATFNSPFLLAIGKDHPFNIYKLQNYYAAGFELGGFDRPNEEDMDCVIEEIKSGKLKACFDESQFVLWEDDYDEIAAWRQRKIKLDFSVNNIKRTIGVKNIVVHRGYGSPDESRRSMRWEVENITFATDDGERECNPFDVPDDFWPWEINIYLGHRINDQGEKCDCIHDAAERYAMEQHQNECCKHLKFITRDFTNETRFLGCIGSLGTLRKLYFMGRDGYYRDYAKFVLHTDEGVYGISTDAYEPGFMTMRFLSMWRENVPDGRRYRALLFNPQLVASIEKAGLAFMSPSRINKYKRDEEVEILSEYAALEYLKGTQEFHIDSWPLMTGAVLGKILWCDKDFMPLGGRKRDFEKVAEYDHGLWSVLSASHPSRDDCHVCSHGGFLAERYRAYALTRNGVERRWVDWPWD